MSIVLLEIIQYAFCGFFSTFPRQDVNSLSTSLLEMMLLNDIFLSVTLFLKTVSKT